MEFSFSVSSYPNSSPIDGEHQGFESQGEIPDFGAKINRVDGVPRRPARPVPFPASCRRRPPQVFTLVLTIGSVLIMKDIVAGGTSNWLSGAMLLLPRTREGTHVDTVLCRIYQS